LETVKAYLAMLRTPQVGISHEARLALRQHHVAELQAAVDREERQGSASQPAGGEVSNRCGSTLVEAMIAMMVALIGLVAVVSLFVLASMRSTEAAKLTKGTNLRHSAEGWIGIHPWIIHNPDQAADPAVHFSENFVFDPLGYAVLATQAPALAATFGNDGAGNATGSLKRYRGTWTKEGLAETLVASQDSWNLQFEAFGANPQPTQIDVPGLSPFALPSRPACRVLMLNQAGTGSQVRTPTAINGNTVAWADPLPPAFTPSKVRVELQDRRYTWLLTVRQDRIGDSTADVVVFFNRALSPQDELLLPATIWAGKEVNGKFVPGKITVTSPAAAIRKGSFIFDADNCWWYSVQNAHDNGDGTCNVVTEFPPAFDSPAAGGHLMMMSGIVGVFRGSPF